MWQSFFSKIYLINLKHRTDRLLASAEQCEKYEIPYTRFEAIEKPNGAEGLRDSMVAIFEEAIKNNYEHILVLEDDFKIIETEHIFHETMNGVVQQLPENYIMCFLGSQLTGRITHWPTPNIFGANKIFSTHSVIYSLRGAKEILATNLDFPIDNHYVAKIEQIGGSYCVYPLLTTQYEGFSDIGKNRIDWDVFIQPKYQQKIIEYKQGRR